MCPLFFPKEPREKVAISSLTLMYRTFHFIVSTSFVLCAQTMFSLFLVQLGQSLIVLVFYGVEKKIPEDVYNGLCPLWLVSPWRTYLRTRVEHSAEPAGAGSRSLSVHRILNGDRDRQVYENTNH